jgi:hypothetical protein
MACADITTLFFFYCQPVRLIPTDFSREFHEQGVEEMSKEETMARKGRDQAKSLALDIDQRA